MKTRCDEASLSASDSRAVLALSALTNQIHSKSMVRSCHLTSPTSALKLGSLISAKSVVANRVTPQVACRWSSLRQRAALRRNEQGVAESPKRGGGIVESPDIAHVFPLRCSTCGSRFAFERLLATGTSRLESLPAVMVTLTGSACTLDRAPSRLVDVGHIWFAQLV